MQLNTLNGFVAEVTGLDITADDLDQHGPALVDALDEHGVMVIRQTAQDDEAYVRFAALFGELQTSTAKLRQPSSDGDDRLVDISNVGEDGKILSANAIQRTIMLSARWWHTDNSFRNPPTRYTILAARVVPSEDGETQFRDMRAAYEALSEPERQRYRAAVAVHDFEHSRRMSGGPEMSPLERGSLPPVRQPMVRTHPSKGTTAIYAGFHTAHIEGLSDEETTALLEELDQFASSREEWVYTHSWQPGDILLWDNRSVQHHQMPYDDKKIKRVLRRTTITDSKTSVPEPV